mgnify:FL=1
MKRKEMTKPRKVIKRRKGQSASKAMLAPIEAKTFSQICKLPRDNYDTAGYWILVGLKTIHFAEQRNGEATTQKMAIPKREFDRLVRWYMTG